MATVSNWMHKNAVNYTISYWISKKNTSIIRPIIAVRFRSVFVFSWAGTPLIRAHYILADPLDESADTMNDGNQNNRQCFKEEADLEDNRHFVQQLKEVYAEFQLHVKLLQKDVVRIAKYDEMHNKVTKRNDLLY